MWSCKNFDCGSVVKSSKKALLGTSGFFPRTQRCCLADCISQVATTPSRFFKSITLRSNVSDWHNELNFRKFTAICSSSGYDNDNVMDVSSLTSGTTTKTQ